MTDITWTNDTRRLADLVPWEHNPKRLSKKAGEGLRVSLDKFGLAIPLVISPNNDLYDGHQRKPLLAMMKEYGPDAMVDVRVSSRVFTDDERREFVIRLRQNQAGWDFDMLPNLYEREELLEWGFEPEELGMFPADDVPDDPGAQVDRAEELREKWGVNVGDLWQLGEHRLICGDCTDSQVVARVMDGEKADLLLSDPPYGKLKIFNSSGAVGNAGSNLAQVRNYGAYHDHATFQLEPMLKALDGFYDKAIIWGGNNFTNILAVTQSWLVWDKRAGKQLFYADCEMAWSDLGITAKVFDFVWQGMIREGDPVERMHPTQKPVQVYEWCLGLADKAMIVLDPTLGSASSLIACERLGRRCRAVEIEPGYVAVALQRWHDMTGVEPVLLS